MDTVKINSKNVGMVAHRGLSGIERENTCPAFVAAANRSYFGIETDIHRTADGKFVVIHDNTTERVTLGQHNIEVEQVDYDTLNGIVLPDRDESRVRQDIRIPLLEEYIAICKKYNKVSVLELKSQFTKDELVKIVDIIDGLGHLQNTIFISFVLENCLGIRELLKDAPVQFLTGEVTPDLMKTLVGNKLDLDIYFEKITKDLIDELHSKGRKVNVWTCDKPDVAEHLIEMGVDFITTNILE